MKFCSRPFNSIHLLPGGAVWPCGWMHLTLGNIIEQEMDEIWNGETAKLARESISDGSFRFCRKESCPFLENDSLPDLSAEEFAQAAKASEGPVEISASYDYICNHSCPSCREKIFVPNQKYIEGLHITGERLLPYLNNADKFSTDGNGDLFASPYIMDLLSKVHPQNKDCRIVLETNGVLFTPENWNKIAHLGQYNLSVTITPNSFERDSFKYLSGGHDNLDQLTENLYFVKKLRESGQIQEVKISIVMQDRNYREVPAFTRACLEQFGADQVILKPLYQWFGMKEEVYWFKNVLNPAHPYHQEYLEMRKDPVFNDSRVFDWGGNHLRDAKTHPAYRYQTNQNILLGLLSASETPEKVIEAAVQRTGSQSIAVYDNSEMGQLLVRLLAKAGTPAKCFLSRFHSQEETEQGIPMYSFPDFKPDAVDTVIITDSYNYNKTEKDIAKLNFRGTMISLEQFLSR